MTKPVVVILGRPNVGKSTFFNRITRTRNAIVGDLSGVTRDSNFCDAVWNGVLFTLVDTGGFTQGKSDVFAPAIRLQIECAITDANMVIVLFDGKSGLSPFDYDLVRLVKLSGKSFLCVVNKIDGLEQEVFLSDFYTVGVKTLYPISAEHGYGISDFLDRLVCMLPNSGANIYKKDSIRVAIIGKPNAGKSSLVNCILGKRRVIVSEFPGTTRDVINSEIFIGHKIYTVIDTAGIRKKSKISDKLEKFSVIKTIQQLNNCDIALIIIDAIKGISEQDVRIAGYAFKRGCGVIFLVNKWDLMDDRRHKTFDIYSKKIKLSAKFLSFAPVMSISALSGLRVNRIFDLIDEVYFQYSTRISTAHLNRIIRDALLDNEPSIYKNRRLKFYYTTQIRSKPPTIVSFVNYPYSVHFSYKRYLINKIRQFAGLTKTPVRLYFRKRV